MDDALVGPVRAEWDWLPPEVTDQIGRELSKRALQPPFHHIHPIMIEYVRDLRRLCAAFARGLRLYVYIFTHRTHPNYVEHLTEGLLRMAFAVDTRIENRFRVTELAIYNYAYCAVYSGCTQKERPRLDEPFYNALREVLTRSRRRSPSSACAPRGCARLQRMPRSRPGERLELLRLLGRRRAHRRLFVEVGGG